MNRRKFLTSGLLASVGAFLIPPALNNNRVYGKTLPRYKPSPKDWPDDRITLTWIGHSTVLINFFGKWILTDPVLFDRVGVYMFGFTWGPTRYSMPALEIDDIPKPDIVLLSHAHMDHMDYLTLKTIAKKYPGEIDFVTSYKSKDVIDDLPWKSIKELDWEDIFEINGVKIKALEVRHFGWRFPWEKDRSRGFMKEGRSYNAYLLERNGKKIIFGGDTANTNKFENLFDENIEIAIMPIGAYRPWRMAHCNPEEALIMADRMKAKYFVPIHCNTFQQGREPKSEPIKWMVDSAQKYNLEIGLKEIGQTFSV